jgi:hypothetical protein
MQYDRPPVVATAAVALKTSGFPASGAMPVRSAQVGSAADGMVGPEINKNRKARTHNSFFWFLIRDPLDFYSLPF